jgi:hypothetical protein
VREALVLAAPAAPVRSEPLPEPQKSLFPKLPQLPVFTR